MGRAKRLTGRAQDAVGGRAHAKAVVLMGAVLGLDGADKGTVSTMAGQLTHEFGIGYTAIGLLVSVVAFVGAVFTIPVGLLTDRVRRTRLLAASVTLWAAAMLMAGAAPSYLWLLVSRAALGAVSATAGPTVGSLIGDFFPAGERARMYGFVLGGELAGTAVGFAVSGWVGGALGWRFAFWWLILPTLVLVWYLFRLPEPERGGQRRIRAEPGKAAEEPRGLAQEVAEQSGVPPHEHLVLHTDTRQLPQWRTVLYVLRVRSNVILIVASSLGYFFFAGLRGFATLFAEHQYGLSSSVASSLVVLVGAGALVGVLVGGRIADRLLEHGRVGARVLVPTVCLLAVPLLLAPGLDTTSVSAAIPLLLCGTALLGAANPPLDAARLDIMPHTLWGTAEGVRTMARTLCEAAAPTLFGYVAGNVFSPQHGLEYTLMLSLAPLLVAGMLGVLALRTYPRDVATADASAAHIAAAAEGGRDREQEAGE